ncbi:unnamed protein product [Larinioides sclopetarius]|uniref:NADH dehydrogenase subunit 1 n=1 Tax=Larinioides sclopetarius TaxID=280406 RepID=A0AAV2A7Q7_9ARAC
MKSIIMKNLIFVMFVVMLSLIRVL